MDDPNRPVTGYPASQPHNPMHNGYSSTHPPPPSGTAYPYAAPPPAAYGAAYYPPQNYPYATQRATFLRRLFAIIIGAFIITGTIIFIIWLVLRPRLPEFRVDSLAVTNLNISSSRFSASWDLRLTARNPNHKITFHYDPILTAIYYRSQSLAETTLPPFDQDTKNETAMGATLATTNDYVNNDVVNGVNDERSRSGTIGFNVRMLARVSFKAGAWRARRRYLRVFCGDLALRLASNGANGTLVGGPRQCRVGL